ncbi:MAG: DUF2802 domain-containing protein [Gammaproteobacteria bacterium]
MTAIENLLSSPLLVQVCLVLVLIQWLFLQRLWRKFDRQGRSLAETQQELQALLSCERGMADRINYQQQQMHGIADRQDRLEINDSSQINYKQAIALMKKGATTNELVEACDLSRGELDLIGHLQKLQKAGQVSRAA